MRKIVAAVMAVFMMSLCAAAQAVEFTDALGREICVEGKLRAACIPGYLAEAWVLSGGELCAVSEDAASERGIEFEGIIAGTAHDPNLELIVDSEPDIVILSSAHSAALELRESLEVMGIDCAYFDVNTYGEYLDMMDIFCEINGTENDRSMEDEIAEIIEASNVNGAEALLLRSYSSGIKAKDSTGVAGEILSDMGFVNIADGGIFEEVTLEAVIEADPEYIFVVSMGSDDEAAMKMVEEKFSSNPAWAYLGAVQNGRVHFLPRELFHLKPNEDWAKSYEYLQELINAQ